MDCWETLRVELLGEQQCAQEYMTVLLEESCRLLKLFDGRWRRNPDQDFVDQQRFGFVIGDEMGQFPKAWTDVAEEEVGDCLYSSN